MKIDHYILIDEIEYDPLSSYAFDSTDCSITLCFFFN